MKIGIDAKWYYNGPPSGHYVVKNMITNLISYFPNHDYYLIFKNGEKYKKHKPLGVNCHVIYTKISSNNFLWNSIVAPFQLSKYKLDICLFQNFSPLFMFNPTKRVSFIHDIIFDDKPRLFTLTERIYFKFIKPLARLSDSVITISNTEKKRLEKHHYHKNIYVVHNGINDLYSNYQLSKDDISRVREKYKIPSQLFILYVGRINLRKNIKTIIDSIKKTSDNLHLVIGGKDNNYRQKLINYVNTDEKLKNKVHFIGYIDSFDMPVIYTMAKLFCFPSIDEGFGLPPLEAMASSTPTIVSDISVFREIYKNGVIYYKPNNVNSLSSIINSLLKDYNKIKILKMDGLKIAKRYTWYNNSKSLIRSFEKIVRSEKNI